MSKFSTDSIVLSALRMPWHPGFMIVDTLSHSYSGYKCHFERLCEPPVCYSMTSNFEVKRWRWSSRSERFQFSTRTLGTPKRQKTLEWRAFIQEFWWSKFFDNCFSTKKYFGSDSEVLSQNSDYKLQSFSFLLIWQSKFKIKNLIWLQIGRFDWLKM